MVFNLDDFELVVPTHANIKEPYCCMTPNKILFMNKALTEMFKPSRMLDVLFKDKIVVIKKKEDSGNYKVSFRSNNSSQISFRAVMERIGVKIEKKVYFEVLEITPKYLAIDFSKQYDANNFPRVKCDANVATGEGDKNVR
jgi:hypothetical protein